MENILLTERLEDILLLTLNRPDKRNALNPELIEALDKKVDEISSDDTVRAVVMTGAGKSFCAGADLAYLRKISEFSEEENLQDSQKLADLFHKIYAMPKLTVAMVNGAALAGGFGLAMCCDYIFADRNHAKLGFTEVRIGFVPAIVSNFLIRKVPFTIASHLAMSGDIISAEEAKSLKIVHETFESEKLKEQTIKFLNEMLEQNSFSSMIQTKKLLLKLTEVPLNSGLEIASETNAVSRKTSDCRKGLDAFLNKKEIKWR